MSDEIRLPVSADTTPLERDISNAVRRVGSINLNANIDSKGLESLTRPLGKITGQADEFSKSMEAANARVLAFGASVGVINAISNAFKNLVTSTVEVEKSLTEIKIIGNETFSDLNKTSAGLFSTAKQLGVSYKDAADSALEFARQGKGLTESLDASRAALALTRTAGIAATEAVMGLTSAVNAFGRGADAYIEYANKMSAVSDSFAVNNKDLIEGLSRSASVAQETGVSFEQLTALITTLQEKTGRGGAVIGNALKTIFTRVQNPEIIKDLRDLGISVQDATTGSFLPAVQIIQNLANEFEGFDKNLRNSILLKVGGGFQVDKLAALLNDVKDASGTYQRSLNIATTGSGDILAKVAKLNQTIDSSFTNVLTSAKQLGSNIGQIAFSKDFTEILQKGASAITSINDAIFGTGGKDGEEQGSTLAKAVLKGIGSVISGPGLALFVGILGKLSIDFAKFSATGLQTLLGITSKSKEEQLIQASISNTLAKSSQLQELIFNLEGNRVAQAEVLLSVIKQQVNESKKLEDISKNAASILYGKGVRLGSGTAEIKGSAGGYIPNLANAISTERKESPAGSKIIVDHNFPMGAGQRGTMVYNSNETRIKNFGGSGGDAIIPNYPINSAKGFTPNFAKEPKQPKRNILDIDARAASIAGLTFADEFGGQLDRAKAVTIDDKLLNKYQGSNFLDTLKKYEAFTISNVPVGSVYRFRKDLKGKEDDLKSDFVKNLNSKFRNQIISFITEEVSGLGLKPGGGLSENLSNLKLDLIGSSTAGYIFEEILKIPTLTNPEKLAQYSNQSNTDFFDIKNLDSSFAEAYGLPKQKFDLVEIKLGQKELKDGIAEKTLNQLIFEKGGADPGKFGAKTKRAASGYIPNFALKYNLEPLTGRIFEALLSGKKRMDLTERSTQADFADLEKLHPYFIEEYGLSADSYEAKTTQKAAFKDPRVGKNKSKGANILHALVGGSEGYKASKGGKKLNFTEIKEISRNALFGIARKVIASQVDKNTNYKNVNIPIDAIRQYLGSDFADKIFNASNGFIPNFANYDISRVSESIGKIPISSLKESFDLPYSTNLSATNYSTPNDIVQSIIGVNFLASSIKKDRALERFERMLSSVATGRMTSVPMLGISVPEKKEDYSSVASGTFTGETLKLNYEDLGNIASNIFSKNNLGDKWQELLSIMQKTPLAKDRTTQDSEKIKSLTGVLRKTLVEKLTENLDKKVQAIETTIPDSDLGAILAGSMNVNLDEELLNKIKEERKAGNLKYLSTLGSSGFDISRAGVGSERGIASKLDWIKYKDVSKVYDEASSINLPNILDKPHDLLLKLKNNFSQDEFLKFKSNISTSLGEQSASEVDSLYEKNGGDRFAGDKVFKLRTLLKYIIESRRPIDLSNVDLVNSLSKITSGEPLDFVDAKERDRRQAEKIKLMQGIPIRDYMSSKTYYDQLVKELDLKWIFDPSSKVKKAEEIVQKPKAQTAQKVFYGEYKKNQQYYDSLGKWKYDKDSKQMILQAARGFVPNFSELMGSGAGMLYSDPNYTELGSGQSGKFLAPKSGEGFGQKIFYRQGSDKIEQEYNINKLIKDFETQNPSLFAKNAISFTNIGKLLTKNGLIAGFEREVVGGSSIDDFATEGFKDVKKKNPGDVNPMADFAFFLSEILAQTGVKNVVGEYRKKYGNNSLRIDDVYAQNFKINDVMQKSLIEETKRFFKERNNKVPENSIIPYIHSLEGNPMLDELNQKFGSLGGRHIMFDTQGFAQSASKGYVPNFASSIKDAIAREKSATGLPDSMIKVSKDSRAINSSLNPEGFIVTNKIDEPRGKTDVSNSRMMNAYNSSRGFVPNFSEKSYLNRAGDAAAAGNAEETKKLIQEVSSSAQENIAATAQVNSSLKTYAELLKELVKTSKIGSTYWEDLFNAINKNTDEINKWSELDQNARKRLVDNINKEADLKGGKVGNILNQIEGEQIKAKIAAETAAATSATAANTATSSAATNKPESDKQTKNTNNEEEKAKKQSTKSLGDLAQSAFIFQSAISFTSGALSTLGKEAESLGNLLNTLGQIGYTVTQGNELFKTISGGKGFGESLKGAFTNFTKEGRRETAIRALRELGPEARAIRAAELGITGTAVGRNAALGARFSGVVAGAGGALATVGIAAGIAAGGYLVYKSIDQIARILNGSVKRTEDAINGFNAIQERYNVTLTDSQKKTVENFVDAADVSTTSLSGFFTKIGFGIMPIFRGIKASLGFTDETYKNKIGEALGKADLNLSEEGTKQFGATLFPLLQPLITNKTATVTNGILTPANQTIQGNELAKILPEYVDRLNKLRSEYQPNKEEIQNFIKENDSLFYKYSGVSDPNLTGGIEGGGSFGANANIRMSKQEEQDLANKKLKEKNSLQFALAKLAEQIYQKSSDEQALLEYKIKGHLILTEEFKKQLEIRIQFAKLETAYASELENVLSARKELLSLDDAEKFSIETRLKSLQEERKTRGEIKNLLLENSKETIFKNIEKTSALGIPNEKANEINKLFKKAETSSASESLDIYKEIIQKQDQGVKIASQRRSELEKEISSLEEVTSIGEVLTEEELKHLEILKLQLEANKNNANILEAQLETFKARINLITEESKKRQEENAQQALFKTIVERTNFYFNLRKEIISSTFEIQNKVLQQKKEELSLAKELRDVDFARSQFLNAPQKTQAQSEFESALNTARENRTTRLENLSQREKEIALQNRQSIFNEISSRAGNDIRLLNKASEAKTTQDLQKVLEEALIKQGGTFEDKVITAAKEFYRITTKAATDSKTGTQDESIIAQANATSDIERLIKESGSSGSFKGIEDRIAELNKLNTSESITLEIALQNRLKDIKNSAAAIVSARTTQAPDRKKTEEVANTDYETAIQKAELEKYKKSTFGGGMMEAYEELKKETDSFGSTMGKSIPIAFRDGIVSALKELSNPNSTQPLKDRLLGVASSFLQKINDGLMQNLANQLTKPLISGFGSFTEGAGMPGAAYASGGYIKGGSGSKDDVPAMLMGGEYVVTKSAVQKYGPSFFDALNSGSIKKFAAGGFVEMDITKYQDPSKLTPYGQRRDQGLSFDDNGQVIGMDSYTGTDENKQNALKKAQSDYYAKNAQTGQGGFYTPGENGMGAIMGQKNLLSFATQQTAGTQFDKISGMGGAGSIDIAGGSSNLSLFALKDEGNIRNRDYLQAKNKSLELYLGGIQAAKEKATKEEELRVEYERIKKEQDDARRTARRKLYQGIIKQVGTAVAMAGLSYAGNAMSKGWSSVDQASGGTATFGEKFKGMFTGGTMGGETRGGLANIFSSSGTKDFSTLVSSGGDVYSWNSKAKDYMWSGSEGFNKAFPMGANYSSSPSFKWGNAMMYAPTRRAAGGFVNGNGMGDNVPTMLNGGEFVISKQAAKNIGANKLQQMNSGNVESENSDAVVSKLDELIEKLNAVGTINITVNSNGKETKTEESGSGSQDKQQKELARKIKEVVLYVLKDEKRLGGLLR